MSNRAQRRAAERASHQTSNAAAPNISQAQLNANRANAQMSTGPTSPTGKETSSHNALKTGLTGRTILLPTDDVAAYQSIVAMVNAKFTPANDIEQNLTQTIADTEWRLLRIPVLESGFYALGRHHLAHECAHERDPQTRAVMLEALIFQTYQKDLRNLALQERRLRSQLKADTAELRRLQTERQEKQKEEAKPATTPQPAATPNGFEFSTPECTSTPQPEVTQENEVTAEATAAA